jgi:hypothetical protein
MQEIKYRYNFNINFDTVSLRTFDLQFYFGSGFAKA